LIVVLTFVISLLISFAITFWIRNVCIRHNLLDHPDQRKIHTTPIPRLGGVGIFLSILVSLLIVFLFKSSLFREIESQTLFVLLSGMVIFGLGLYDDLKSMKPGIKLIFQAIASLILILAGLRISLIHIPFYRTINLGWFSYPLTLIWFLVIVNAMNLLDGLDGLAAGVSVIAAGSLLVVGYMLKVDIVLLISGSIAGSCLGFLRYNYFPASIFMGDSGSLFLGYLFALMAIICPIKSYTSMALFVPLLALGVPLIEITISSFRRIIGKQTLYLADKRHIFHFLIEKGFSHRDTVWLFYLLSLIFAIMVISLLTQSHKIAFPLVFLLILTFGTIFVSWYNKTQAKLKAEK
jgi:UDP-GlcNAc:undecaprenyl-phosphate/decaprenyl-phosphate GlcNAc-1-phosphate transferase